MYLKRLEMKGFKSFADKVSVTLEPGISAIVGPNGSGKSNICDAILWVLGERNAKSLRGAVMEDVIFAGSSKRSSVSMAEVSLVLDNTDGLLPIEYNEVSVSRRLYRSGESEYLINGVTSRRLDVLDILHDSGIGTDTNSIISQGHLDSILQSKPMDRRTLIEEAAGVLKHKQRKIRSERKIERMELNLERIGDVMAEIERQLKPLRIKAKRAEAYDGLVAELSGLNLEIAVDDLKKIKAKWDKVEAQQKQIKESVDNKREEYEQKDKDLTELRQKISSQNADIVEYSTKQRSLNSAIDKLATSAMLLQQKAQNAQEKYNTLAASSSETDVVSPEKKVILDEINDAETKLNAMKNEASELRGQSENAKKMAEEAQAKLENLEKEYDQRTSDLQKFQHDIEDYKTMIKIADALKTREEKKTNLDKSNKKLEDNNAEIEKLSEKANNQLESLDNLNNQLQDVNANILAIEKILETSYEESSDASKWLDKNRSKFGQIKNLSDEIKVSDKYLSLVEALLGNFSSSFLSANKDISRIKKEISKVEDAHGSVRLVSNTSTKFSEGLSNSAKDAAKKFGGIALCDEVKVSDSNLFGALANVVVFEESDDAFKAAEKTEGLCCAALDGTLIYPDGRYVIGGPFYVDSAYDSDSSRTILTYKKNLMKLKSDADKLSKKVSDVQTVADETDKKLAKLREVEMEIKNEFATNKAEYDFANSYFEELKSSLGDKNLINEIKSSNISKYEKQLEGINNEIENSQEWLKGSVEELNSAREQSTLKKNSFNEFMVKQAALDERVKSQEGIVSSTKNRLSKLEEKEIKNLEVVKESKFISSMCTNLSEIFVRIENLAKRDLEKLDESFSSVNEAVIDIQKKSDEAIAASNTARKAFDTENQKLSEVQVELGRLEVQVQNAVDVIDNIEGISVDKALEMPDIEDRSEKEERQFKLRRRIANMGVINPDAKQEYDVLKERYDFLNGQVQDLYAAKISLAKIDKIIDERMKDDFINTFDEVNANFKEIFSVLFPGGRARLELELPNDIENSGVEVKAQPHGKSISKMSLLSGGEKSLVALCLLFAVYKKRSTPFYILDEVEAALDDTNLRRLIKYLEDLRDTTQLIMITHQRRTMEMADVLYGVSMKNDGVTRVVSQRLDKDNRLHDIDK